MKNKIHRFLILLIGLFIAQSYHPSFASDPGSKICKDEFKDPSTEYRPWVYWYWMNGNVSKEGAIADIQAMAEVGIGGVFLMDIGIFPQGAVTYRSKEWWDIVHAVAKECAKNNMKISFNCPGWALAGGPWIDPEHAMKELTWSEVQVGGGHKVDIQLPKPAMKREYYKEIATLAFPRLSGEGDNLLNHAKLQTLDGKEIKDWERALSRDNTSPIRLPNSLIVSFDKPTMVKSMNVNGLEWYRSIDLKLSTWDGASNNWEDYGRIRSKWSGFSHHNAGNSFPEREVQKLRIDFVDTISIPTSLTYLHIGSDYRISDWPNKVGFSIENEVGYHRDTTIAAGNIINIEEIVDLTSMIDSTGRLKWDAPILANNREWTILRIGYTTTAKQTNPYLSGVDQLEADKLSKEGTRAHYQGMWRPIFEKFGPELSRKVLFANHIDSYEAGWQNWTKEMPAEFNVRNGYSITKFLPVLTGRVVKDPQTSEKFLWDFRKTISSMYSDNFYREIVQLSKEDGLKNSSETYGGPFEHLGLGTQVEMPMVEKFWPFDTHQPFYSDPIFAGRTSGAERIGYEAFTSTEDKWRAHPYRLKREGDHIFTSGVNWFVLHVYASQPYTDPHMLPGFTCGAWGVHLDRGNTWFKKSKAWMSYLSRCQYLLRQGKPMADILYYTGSRSFGESGPYNPATPEGYKFDVIATSQLAYLKVDKGDIVLPSGKRYKLLVYSPPGDDQLFSLQQIDRILREGATVLGNAPSYNPSLSDQLLNEGKFNELQNKLWANQSTLKGEQKIELGNLMRGYTLEEVLNRKGIIKDFSYTTRDGAKLLYEHRNTDDTDIYFVANVDLKKEWAVCNFRVTGKTPQIWDPETGMIENWPVYFDNGESTTIPLFFEQSESKFIIFKERDGDDLHLESMQMVSSEPQNVIIKGQGKNLKFCTEKAASFELKWSDGSQGMISVSDAEIQEVPGPWKVNFPATWGAPEEIDFPRLIPWNEHEDFGIRHFSGTAKYTKTIRIAKIKKNQRFMLDLGRVDVIAQVRLNDIDLGILWRPPYQVDITDALVKGNNQLEIEVVNLWLNRLIGDENYPDDVFKDGKWASGGLPSYENCNDWFLTGKERPEKRRLTFTSYKHWSKNDSLVSSGLIGPVTLQISDYRSSESSLQNHKINSERIK